MIDTINIYPLNENDIEKLYLFETDPDINALSGILAIESYKEFFDRYKGYLNLDFNNIALKIYSIKYNDLLIGRFEYKEYEEGIEFGIVIGDKHFQKLGIASIVLNEFFKYIFNNKIAKCIFAEVFSHNEVSIKLMEKLGGKVSNSFNEDGNILYIFERESFYYKLSKKYDIMFKYEK